MTSHDVRDVLNIPLSSSSTPRPHKRGKSSAPRPNLKGLAREVQNLGGDTPIAIVPEASVYKKRRLASRKPAVKWELRRFNNSARQDGSLVLRHWKRRVDTARPDVNIDADEGDHDDRVPELTAKTQQVQIDDSAFARYNVNIEIPHYNDEQYESKLQSADWTREETDYLMSLARDFDLRWPVMWDRYDFQLPTESPSQVPDAAIVVVNRSQDRSMEQLKARYYHVAAKMLEIKKPPQTMNQAEWDLHQMMSSFKPEQERRRKDFAMASLSRSKEEAREEESLLLEVKRIQARSDRFNEERRELYGRLDYPNADQDISSFKSSTGLSNLLQTLVTADKTKKRRPHTNGEPYSPANGVSNGVPGSAASEHGPDRRGSIAGSQTGGQRDSIGALGGVIKKGLQQLERRKLSESEEQLYGLSHHERLSSGPAFRVEKINKLFSSKSGQQQTRITNALTELEVSARVNMPTAAVSGVYERLVASVANLVDLKKHADKVEAEIKVEGAKRQTRLGEAGEMDIEGDNEAAESLMGGVDDSNMAETSHGTDAATVVAAAAAAAAGSDVQYGRSGHKRSASVLSVASDKSSKRQKK